MRIPGIHMAIWTQTGRLDLAAFDIEDLQDGLQVEESL